MGLGDVLTRCLKVPLPFYPLSSGPKASLSLVIFLSLGFIFPLFLLTKPDSHRSRATTCLRGCMTSTGWNRSSEEHAAVSPKPLHHPCFLSIRMWSESMAGALLSMHGEKAAGHLRGSQVFGTEGRSLGPLLGLSLGGWGMSFKVSSGWGPTMKLSPREDWGSLQGQAGGDTPVPFSSPLVKWPSKGIHFIRWEHSELFIVFTQ